MELCISSQPSGDRLDALLARFRVSAQVFHSGALCGTNDFAPLPGLGQLHLVQRGPLRIEHERGVYCDVHVPSLLFYPRPVWHRFVSDPSTGADMACAHLRFGDGSANPLTDALPAFVLLPLHELDGAGALLETLFAEAFARRCGRQLVVDRLFEVVLVLILRHLLDRTALDAGLLAGLAHPQLARVLIAVHAQPGAAWTLERLASTAGMSRSRFADVFHRCVGLAPGDYVSQWRLALVQDLLRRGRPLKLIVDDVGYGSIAALSRAFKARFGLSPRDWKTREIGS